MRSAILGLLALWALWACICTITEWFNGTIQNNAVLDSVSLPNAIFNAFIFNLFWPLIVALTWFGSVVSWYPLVIMLYPYATLYEFVSEWCRTNKWNIDWIIHPAGVVFALVGLGIFPLAHFVAWWAGLIALLVYVAPIILTIICLAIIVCLEQDQAAEIAYDGQWPEIDAHHANDD